MQSTVRLTQMKNLDILGVTHEDCFKNKERIAAIVENSIDDPLSA